MGLLQVLDAIDFMHWRLPAASKSGFCIHRDISPGMKQRRMQI